VLQMIRVGSSGGSVTAGAVGSIKVALRELGVIRHARVSEPLLPLNAEESAAVLSIVRETRIAEDVPAGVGM